jgi:hypothetical protein
MLNLSSNTFYQPIMRRFFDDEGEELTEEEKRKRKQGIDAEDTEAEEEEGE